MTKRCAAGLFLLAVWAVPVAAQDWPRFRGPGGQGIAIAANLPAAFTEKHVRFRVSAGRGHSSPVVYGGRVYLTRLGDPDADNPHRDASTRERALVCFDAADGAEHWTQNFEFTAHPQHNLNSFASSTPVVDDSGVYLLWSSGTNLVAVAVELDGKPRWTKTVGRYRTSHGSGSSPVICGELVILASDNEGDESHLTALDKATGKPRWRLKRRSAARRGAFSTPVLYRPAKGDPYLLFTSTAHGLTAVDPATGKQLWNLELGFRQRFVSTVSLAGDIAYLSSGAGGGGKECALVRLRGDKPEIVHRLRRSLPYVPSALALGGYFYTFSDGGVASCVKAENGETVWRKRIADATFFSSPVSNGRTIWIADRSGVLHSLAPSEEFKSLGALDLGAPVFATPAIANGALYVRTAEQLICLGSVAEKVKDPVKK